MNPFVGLVLSKGGGLLPLYVLHLLSRQPRYGNDIMRELEERSRGTWASNPGAIYPLLRLLERHGLLRGEWEDADKRTRRIYQLTEKGRREYEELKEMMQYGLQEALAVLQKLYDELYPEPVPVAEGGTAPRVA
jgi:DNA-binding PadR family transcriptional regulator